jgi:NADPH-dependent ferric siderophore reductase
MSAPGLDSLKWIPAQDFTLLIARVDGRDIRRRYTIAGQQDHTVLCDVYLHGQGIGTSWAGALRNGDAVSGIGPRRKFLLESDAEWLVVIGDETSLPGIRAMLATTEWAWLPRSSAPDDGVLALPSSGDGHACVSGQAERVRHWRSRLESMGFDPSAISHKAYWGAGRANATHGEPLE